MGAVMLVFVAIPFLFYLSHKYARSARARCHPHDLLLINAVRAAGVISKERDGWRTAPFVRNAHGALEALAVRAQLSLALKGRVDAVDFGLRRELRLEAQRVAASIRSLKPTISTASGPESVDRVLQSLINGIEAIAKIDRQALLDGAPPLPSGVSRLRAAAARMLPGAVLIGASFLVPLIPAISADGHVASTVRWTLLITGVTWIVSASSEATGRVGDVLGKAMPFK
uniref:Type II secretion system protein GspF domain-containing protein n=1 Tax=Streptomyces sp. NBC_00003 TaxID=2903608 RepID=A0AAU2UXF6_9ACTN